MKRLLTIAIFLTAFSSAFAAINKPNIFGINLNENTVILKGESAPNFADYSNYDVLVSFDAMIGFNTRFGIHTGAGLLINSASYINGDNDSGIGTHYSSDPKDDASFGMAIQIPAMARFYASKAFFLEAGATFDLNLFEEFYSGKYDEWNSNDDQKFLNVEIGGGLGFTLGFGLELSFKYTHGLTNMYKHEDTSNSRLTLGLGYWFNYR